MVRFSLTRFVRMGTYIFVGNASTIGVLPATGAILSSTLGGLLTWYFFIGNGEMRFSKIAESFCLDQYS